MDVVRPEHYDTQSPKTIVATDSSIPSHSAANFFTALYALTSLLELKSLIHHDIFPLMQTLCLLFCN